MSPNSFIYEIFSYIIHNIAMLMNIVLNFNPLYLYVYFKTSTKKHKQKKYILKYIYLYF